MIKAEFYWSNEQSSRQTAGSIALANAASVARSASTLHDVRRKHTAVAEAEYWAWKADPVAAVAAAAVLAAADEGSEGLFGDVESDGCSR